MFDIVHIWHNRKEYRFRNQFAKAARAGKTRPGILPAAGKVTLHRSSIWHTEWPASLFAKERIGDACRNVLCFANRSSSRV